MIELKHLKKVFEGGTPFTDINAVINKGDAISIIGPSGTGKTTLLRCINMMDPPTTGQVIVDGEDVTVPGYDLAKLRKKVGMVFQSFNLFEHYTVVENIMEPQMLLLKKSKQEAYDRAIELLKTVNLSNKALAYPSELSGGQKQRVAIARTLAMDPEVILFDEPTSALDPAMVGEVEDVMKKLKKMGTTMLVVTHEMRFAREIANRVFFLSEGGIYEEGSPEEIFDHPSKPLTQEFFSRKKTCEMTLSYEDNDFFSMATTFREFMEPYGASKRQRGFFSVLCDELLYPLFDNSKEIDGTKLAEGSNVPDDSNVIAGSTAGGLSVHLKLVCNDINMNHKMVISIDGLDGNPMEEPYMDDLNRSIFQKQVKDLTCEQVNGSWQIGFTLVP